MGGQLHREGGAKPKSVPAAATQTGPRPQGGEEAVRCRSLGGGRARCPFASFAPSAGRGRGRDAESEMNERLRSSGSCGLAAAAFLSAAASSCPNPGRTQSGGPSSPRRPPPAAAARSARGGSGSAEGHSRGARRAVEQLPRRERRAEGPGSGAEGSAGTRHGRAGGRRTGCVPLARPPLSLELARCARVSSGFSPFFFSPSAERS